MTTKTREEGADMMVIGVDYHPSFQTIAFLIEETGEYGEQELNPVRLYWMWRNGWADAGAKPPPQ
jgi:hypothetical protein